MRLQVQVWSYDIIDHTHTPPEEYDYEAHGEEKPEDIDVDNTYYYEDTKWSKPTIAYLTPGDYSNRYLIRMRNAVQVVRDHGSRLPEAVQADAQLQYFRAFGELERLQDMLRPLAMLYFHHHLLSQSVVDASTTWRMIIPAC